MSKLNRMRNKNIATKSMIEKAFNSCPNRTEKDSISLCSITNTSCKYAIENKKCKMLLGLSNKKEKVVI